MLLFVGLNINLSELGLKLIDVLFRQNDIICFFNRSTKFIYWTKLLGCFVGLRLVYFVFFKYMPCDFFNKST